MQPLVQVISKSKIENIEVEIFSNRVGPDLEYGYTLYKMILENRFSFDDELVARVSRRVCIGGSPAKYKTVSGAERAARKEASPGSAAFARAWIRAGLGRGFDLGVDLAEQRVERTNRL